MATANNTLETLLNEHGVARITGLSLASVRRWHSSELRVLECLTRIEIIAYRAVPLITFLIYAFKHIKAEWLAP